MKSKRTATNNSQIRAEKVKAQTEYTEVNKRAEWSIRVDKKKYVEDLATTVEKAVREVKLRQLHATIKKLEEKYNKPEWPFKKSW